MISSDHQEFIKKSYAEYKRIGYVECPAFNNEKVYFNKIGFNHLLWKGKKMRKPEEQARRINLIHVAVKIIQLSIKWINYREDTMILGNGKVSEAYFWSLSQRFRRIEIRVIIRQTNGGRKYFLSVM